MLFSFEDFVIIQSPGSSGIYRISNSFSTEAFSRSEMLLDCNRTLSFDGGQI